MKKFFILVLLVLISSDFSLYASQNNGDKLIKNSFFSVLIPKEFYGDYSYKTDKNTVYIYHTNSKNSGFGGFVFGVRAYKNPSDHAELPGGRKIGELIDKRGTLYDIVLKYPTDVQYDYTKSSEPPASYKNLYNYGEHVKIEGIRGSRYFKNHGMQGKDLYKDVLKRHIISINEKWDSGRLEDANMSPMYNVIKDKNKIGYVFYDINKDGIDELLIGEISKGEWKGVIYDIYTMVNRTPRHVISGWDRNRYFVCDDAFVCNEYSSGALESGVRTYILIENSTELFPQVHFKYDAYKNPQNPWFLTYGDENDESRWENVSEKKYMERKKVFEKFERFDFTPLNTYKNDNDIKPVKDKYNIDKDYFDYSVVLDEFPKDYYYTTVKINKSKERILIVTDKINGEKNSYHGLFYYFAKNGFVYPLGYLKSDKPLFNSNKYLYLQDKNKFIQFYMSDKNLEIKTKNIKFLKENVENIKFDSIKSAERFKGEYGEPAGDDVVKAKIKGFYFEYHKTQYKKKFINKLMKECINEGVKTQVQMYCCVVKKIHP